MPFATTALPFSAALGPGCSSMSIPSAMTQREFGVRAACLYFQKLSTLWKPPARPDKLCEHQHQPTGNCIG